MSRIRIVMAALVGGFVSYFVFTKAGIVVPVWVATATLTLVSVAVFWIFLRKRERRG